MADKQQFIEAIKSGYTFKGEIVKVGTAMLDGEVVSGADVSLPLKTMNRHCLIAGATGTGKTKTLQMMIEALSDASVPVLVMDIKGDLSGIAMPGTTNDKIVERCTKIGVTFTPKQFPVEFLTLSQQKGVRLRATVSEFGPVLLTKILGLSDTQGGLVALLLKYCDDNKLPLLDLKDFIKVLQYISGDGRAAIERDYGKISTTSIGTIWRRVMELQLQGADVFFGEKSFEVEDLMRINDDGYGMINVLRVTDIQDRPKLFSTFMLQLLAELYAVCPEEGDIDKPKLVLFIDEAHLIFHEASEPLLQQIETVIGSMSSKGIGVFFVTQNLVDVPVRVRSQLGLKVQHAVRAFTGADRKVIKQTVENYPESQFYDMDQMITQLGMGEVFLTMLNEKGFPTPLVHVMLNPPRSRMGVLTDSELDTMVAKSKLVPKYNRVVDCESAYEILNAKLEEAAAKSNEEAEEKQDKKYIITRNLLGSLGLGGKSRSRSNLFPNLVSEENSNIWTEGEDKFKELHQTPPNPIYEEVEKSLIGSKMMYHQSKKF